MVAALWGFAALVDVLAPVATARFVLAFLFQLASISVFAVDRLRWGLRHFYGFSSADFTGRFRTTIVVFGTSGKWTVKGCSTPAGAWRELGCVDRRESGRGR